MGLTVKQYRDAIANSLSSRQIETLQILYYCPDSSAKAIELTRILSPTSDKAIVANGAIGRIGKALSNYLGITPETYFDGRTERPGYFLLVGPYTERGWKMIKNLKRALDELGLTDPKVQGNDISERLPTEALSFEESTLFKEGTVIQVYVDRFERNQKARLKCIEHFGDRCFVCEFDFGKVYGDIAKGFIHVHHKRQLAEVRGEYSTDPITYLVPVCANCHSVIHLTKPPMTIQEIKKRLRKSSR
jgi:predicted HNH restriction endonuclease